MIKHIVFWNLLEEAEGAGKSENADKIKTMLEELVHHIPQIKHIEVGKNFNKSEFAFDLCLFSLFESKEDLEIYQNHEKHKQVAEFMKKVVSRRAVCDFDDYS